jgi:SAM-dependent methyltransferase
VNDRVDFDNYVENYNELIRDATGSFTSDDLYFARYKADLTLRALPDGFRPRRVFEFGCGIGRNIPFLQERFPDAEVSGSDISAASIEQARKDFPDVAFFVEDRSNWLTSADLGTFDLIFVAGVYHHVPPADRADVTKAIAERMSPGARLIVFEHNPYNPVTRKIVADCPFDTDAVLLKPFELKRMLRKAGLDVTRREFTLFIPPRLKGLLFLEKFLSWMPLGGQYFVVSEKR